MTRIERMGTDQKKSGVQFTLRSIFIAAFWAALTCGAWVADFKWQGSDGLMIAMKVFALVGPFIALGALFNRAGVGGIVGVVLVGGCASFVYHAITSGWWEFP
jgi:hypothetical protein